jgi:hypothetical protein
MTEALSYLTLSTHFLRLAEGSSSLLVKRRNALSVVSGSQISPDEYFRKTQWSDHAVGVAILFNFYHGIELVLKGCISFYGNAPKSHSLSVLLEQFEQHAPDAQLALTLAKYIREIEITSPLGQFLSENAISIDSWYESLKYPKSVKGKPFSHTRLKYRGESAVKFWSSIRRGAATIRKHSVAFSREVGAA